MEEKNPEKRLTYSNAMKNRELRIYYNFIKLFFAGHSSKANFQGWKKPKQPPQTMRWRSIIRSLFMIYCTRFRSILSAG